MFPLSRFLSSVALLGVAVSLLAQPPAAVHHEPPLIHMSATEVVLDLVVRDKKGHLVRHLEAADVEVHEDGAKQRVNGCPVHYASALSTAASQCSVSVTAPALRGLKLRK